MIASAPGKVILFGEHAVVYNRPAIVMAINKQIHVKSDFCDTSDQIINSLYVRKSVELVRNKAKEMQETEFKNYNININIKSELPISSGLGSSGALCVATIKSVSMLLGLDLNNREIVKMGQEVECDVQGFSSGIDPFISTYGGIIYYNNGKFERLKTEAISNLNFLIIHSGTNSNTKDMVKKVAELKKEFPMITNKVFDTIGEITEEARSLLENNIDLYKLGHLMNINQGLLESLRVSTSELSTLFYKALKSGALGAKLTGSGGGGCLLSLYPQGFKCNSNTFENYESFGCEVSMNGICNETKRIDYLVIKKLLAG